MDVSVLTLRTKEGNRIIIPTESSAYMPQPGCRQCLVREYSGVVMSGTCGGFQRRILLPLSLMMVVLDVWHK